MRILLDRFKLLTIAMFLLAFCGKSIGQTTQGTAYIWSTTTSWTPTGVPTSSGVVTVNHPLTLDQNLTITTGNYTFNNDVTDQPGGTNYNLTNVDAAGSLTIASGTTIIGGVTSIGGNATFTLTVKSGATLVLGTPGSTSDNFLIGNKVAINIESGGTMIVYGNILNSNSSGTFTVNGLLQVYGDYKTDNGNLNINGTTGQFYTTGSMQTQGSSTIYGSGNECVSNCSGTSLGCGSGGNSYTATIAPQSQTVCSDGAIATMTFTTNAPSPTYEWQYSLTAGGTFTPISGANSNTYSPSSLTVTRWYRVKYTSTSCSGNKYSAPVPVYVSASTYTQSTAGQTVCAGTFGPISVSAFGTALSYQWYSNNSAANSGGSLISGAISNIYTPSSAIGGTKYYYCEINSSCGTSFKTAVSGAFTVNLNSVTAASSTPTPCVNTLMTNITHTTTGASGIGTAIGLPAGVSALWTSNTITISGTPTETGTFNYSIPLSGGCGNLNAIGTITVNSKPSTPTITVGGPTTFCSGGSVILTASAGTSYLWSTGDTTQSISAISSGSYTVQVTNASGCQSSSSIATTITVNPLPVITTQPTTQLDCEGASVNFTAVATGTGLTYTWQRKKPTDASFITIPAEGNITYPSVGKIKIDNVGSFQSLSGTQYQVVVTNSDGCSVTSSAATLLVNEITGISPTDTNVVKCYGTNYSYTVSTSTPPPGSVISYQWKSSVASGVWNNVVNGVHFSGATTATLNILNGTPAQSADYKVQVIFTSSGADCTVTTALNRRITFLPEVTPPVPTITQPDCITSTGSVTLSGLPASGTWTLARSGTSSATTTGSGISTTISGLATGTYNFTVTNASVCTSLASSNVVINAQPFTPVQPTLGTVTQPTCSVSTGSVTITNYDAGYIYTVSPSIGVTVSESTISAPVGSYTVTATLGSCISIASSSFAILPLVTKTWNGAWSPAGTPTSNHIVIIDANYNTSSNGDLNACSLTVNTGSTLTINEGKFVIIQNDLTVHGSLDVLDKGSLVMVEDAGIVTNNGTTNIHRFTTPFKKYDYTYWSTPVVSTNIASTFSGWNTGYSYEYIPANFSDANADGIDDDGNDWSFASTMTPGNGYIIMVPTPVSGPATNNPSEVVFSGKVNNGIQKITNVKPDSSYLLGNPYPSALDAEAFLDYNAGVLDGTLYFWTHNTAIQAANSSNTSLGTGAFAFTSDDYASYNAVGGVGVGSGSAATSGVTIPTGKIGSGQGFFASSLLSATPLGDIVFNNAMRLGSGGTTLDNSQFFKTRNPKEKTANPIQKNRIWLNLTNAQGAFKQTLIGYVTNATNDYDSRFDGVSYDGNEFVDFYSVNQDKNLVIQGRALPFDENDEVPLGYRTVIDGTFTINIEQVDGLLANQQVFIEDKLTNTISDLKNGNYTFTTAVGTFNERFVLRYKNNTSNKTLSVDETTEDNDGIIVIYSNNYKTLIIRNNGDSTINTVSLFSMTGQNISVWDVKDSEQTSIQIPIKDISPGIYIVKVKTTMGESSKKIIIR